MRPSPSDLGITKRSDAPGLQNLGKKAMKPMAKKEKAAGGQPAAQHRNGFVDNGVGNSFSKYTTDAAISQAGGAPIDFDSEEVPPVVFSAHNDFTVAADSNQSNTEPVPLPPLDIAPPLPTSAQLTAEELAEAAKTGKFLHDYVKFASEASPMTPKHFHIASALNAVAIAVARRVYVEAGTTKIYPNLYQLYVGPSTTQRKTTGLAIQTGLLEAAGMIPLFTLAERQTPEAFTEDLTLNVPNAFERMSPTSREAWHQRRRLYAQRGWILDECSHLFDSLDREYTSGLLPMLLDLYDSKDRTSERNTKSYGNEAIEKAYINLFGASTFAAMSKHMAKQEHWNNGLFARFSLVASRASGTWQFWPAPMQYPEDLINSLKFIAFGLFGNPPGAIILEDNDKEESILKRSSGLKVHVETLTERPATVEPEAFKLWERYAKATGHDMLVSPERGAELPENLHANYGRFGTMMIKVATLFAVMDAQDGRITIRRRHILAAQQIVEMWRESLHMVYGTGSSTQANHKEQQVLNVLAKNGDQWTVRRDVQNALKWSKSDLEPVIKDLIADGSIECKLYKPARGKESEQYRIAKEAKQKG